MKSFTTHSMIIGLLVLTLIFTVPVGGVLGENNGEPPGNTEVEEKTKAQWKFDSSQCSVAIDVHKNRNLHRQSLVPGEYLTWSNSFNDSQLTVTTESNCYHGYVVSVYASNTHPNPDTVNVLEDFELAAEKGSTYADPGSVSITLTNDWNSFDGTGSTNSLSLGKVEESDKHGNLNNVDGTEWIMDYRYKMDDDDIPNTEYFVELTYVVSSE